MGAKVSWGAPTAAALAVAASVALVGLVPYVAGESILPSAVHSPVVRNLDPNAGGIAAAADPTSNAWTNITSGEYGGMPPRWGMASAEDVPGNLDLFFGGEAASGAVQNDTWITDDATIANVTDSIGEAAPPPLVGASLSYDPVAGYFVLFGGRGPGGHLSNATWELAPNLPRWVQLTASAGAPPPAQAFGAMAYDPWDGFTVFESTVGPDPVWTFAGGTWTHRTLAAPPVRVGATLTADDHVASLILFGGAVGSAPTNDTWAFTNGAWQALGLPHAPPPSSNGSAAYDPTTGLLVTFGGSDSSGTWGFNGTDWAALAAGSPSGPSPRIHAQMVYDPYGSFITLFGGRQTAGNALLGDFWAWNPPGPPGDPTVSVAAIPSWVYEVGVAAVVLPILAAMLFYRPPKPKPAEAPAATASPAAA